MLTIANNALMVKELLTRLKLLNWGVNETVKGPDTVGRQTLVRPIRFIFLREGRFYLRSHSHGTTPRGAAGGIDSQREMKGRIHDARL